MPVGIKARQGKGESNLIADIKDKIIIVKPETLLKWQRNLIKSFWIFPRKSNNPGRPPTPLVIKELILRMKNDNLSWGAKKIRGELLKLGIEQNVPEGYIPQEEGRVIAKPVLGGVHHHYFRRAG